jgi:signal transduction histidine kinase
VWGETWRVLAAAAVGLAIMGIGLYDIDLGSRVLRSPLLVVLDVALYVTSLGLLLLRRRAPLTIALLLTAFTFVAASPSGAAGIATISLATRRRWRELVPVAVGYVASGLVFDLVYPMPGGLIVDDAGHALLPDWVVNVASGLVAVVVNVGIGLYIGTRRELVRSLRERAEVGEREQARRVAQAQASERARIAREMHDVLAHRMSLVAMHAGALSYRIDLSADQVRETAALIRDSAHLALEELRGVLGVLRDADSSTRPERPQPTLDELDELVAQARATGTPVRVVRELDDAATLPTRTSRNAYRILQEALTNARKHAPGSRVLVELRGSPGDGLTLLVGNPLLAMSSAAREPMAQPPGTASSGLPGAGLGLAGLAERAELAGGTLTFGEAAGRFELRAWLPWAT